MRSAGDAVPEGLWFPFTHTDDLRDFPPIEIIRGEGVCLYGADGKQYLDAISSWWVNTLGHCNPRITAAVQKQAGILEHVIMAGFVSSPTIRLVDLLSRILPKSLSHMFFSDDGSTAVEVGLKIALQYWARKNADRTEFISLGGGYHGDTLGAVSVSGSPQFHGLFHKAFRRHHVAASPYCYRCPMGKNKETCTADCIGPLEEILQDRGENIAACIFEPMVQGAAGMRIYPAKVLTRIISACARYGVLTIADEVAMGFGRTGRMFACEHAGIVPDIMCLAKGLTGGYLPLALTVTTDALFDQFRGDFRSDATLNHGHSFTGNPLGCAAACAAMEIMIEQEMPASLAPLISRFQAGLEEFKTCEWAGDVRSIGMVGAVELVSDRVSKKPFSPDKRTPFRIGRAAIDRGVIIRPLGDVIYFIAPYVITPEQIDRMFSVTREAVEAVIGS